MSSYIDEIASDCEKFTDCSKKCPHYETCITKFGVNEKKESNPSTLHGEISNFETYESVDNSRDSMRINICEVPGVILNKAIISQFNSEEDIEIKGIISAALNKFNVIDSSNTETTIIKYDKYKYHFVFKCVDCSGLNDFIDYSMNDHAFFYCRYCGKKHKFDLSKTIDKSKSVDEIIEDEREKVEFGYDHP